MNLTTNNFHEPELIGIIKKGEGTTVEFKLRLSSVGKLANLICAFANTKGGLIITGVDDNGNVIGVDSCEETESVFQEAINMLEPRPEIRITRYRLDGKGIVVGLVARGEMKPYRVLSDSENSLIYIRVGSAIQPLTRSQARQLADEDQMCRKVRITELHRILLDDIAKKKAVTIRELAHLHNLSIARTSRLLAPLLQSGMIVRQGHGRRSRYQAR